MEKTVRIIPSKHTFLQEVEGDAVLLNIENNQYYSLNPESYHMYSALVSSADLGAAFEVLLREYHISPQQLWQDLEDFINALVDSGLVQVIHAPVA